MSDKEIVTICLSPAIQRTLLVPAFSKDSVVQVNECLVEAGGKSVFVAKVLHQLDIPVRLLTHGGKATPDFETFVLQPGFAVDLVPTPSRIRTCTTVVEVDEARSEDGKPYVRSITEFVEPSAEIPPETGKELISRFAKLVDRTAAVVLSGSLAPGYDIELCTEFCKTALAHQCLVTLDIRGPELLAALVLEPHLVKININEFAQTFLPAKLGWIEQCEEEKVDLHREMVKDILIDLTEDSRTAIIISRGPHSVWYAVDGAFFEYNLPNISRNLILNPTGSGDAFAAGLNAALLRVANGPDLFRGVELDILQDAMDLGIKCAQDNAKTLRPGSIIS